MCHKRMNYAKVIHVTRKYMRISNYIWPKGCINLCQTSCSEDLNIHGHLFSHIQLAHEKPTSQGIF